MGISARLVLPPGTRAQDVADAIGALLGCKIDRDAKFCPDVIGPKIEPADIPTSVCTYLIVSGEHHLWDRGIHWMLHHEWGSDGRLRPLGPGAVGIIGGSSPLTIALFKRLADLFGGKVLYSDGGDLHAYDYEPDEPEVARANRCDPYTDEIWRAMKDHISVDVVPLTYAEVEAAREVSSYQDNMPDRPIEVDDAAFLSTLADQLDGDGAERLRKIAERVS